MAPKRIPKLPALLATKIYKTGQTRGADDDVIFQNRVGRNSTVLIPYRNFEVGKKAPDNDGNFENGFIVLLKPEEYFQTQNIDEILLSKGLKLGENAILFYETRSQWNNFNPIDKGLEYAKSRKPPLQGCFVARVPSTTAENSKKIIYGFDNSGMKGAGIRLYEYASSNIINLCKFQLEFLYWKCENSREVAKFAGMTDEDIDTRLEYINSTVSELNLDDIELLQKSRIINQARNTICPLCLAPLSANGFYSRLEQADGRDVPDLTVTQISLFHIRELRMGNLIIAHIIWGGDIIIVTLWLKMLVLRKQYSG